MADNRKAMLRGKGGHAELGTILDSNSILCQNIIGGAKDAKLVSCVPNEVARVFPPRNPSSSLESSY